MNRTYGVELEFTGISREAAARVITETGISAISTHYTHQTMPHWKIVHDQSVTGSSQNRGGEAVSPILSGIEGFEEIRKVCEALETAGATVDRKCGLHVHIHAPDLTPENLKVIAKRYQRYEKKIDRIMPRSRRDSNHSLILPVGRRADDRFFLQATTVEAALNSTAWGSRFCKLNPTSWLRYKTIEFRHHSGTLDHTKIEMWVRFCHDFVEVSINGHFTPGNVISITDQTRQTRVHAGRRGQNKMALRIYKRNIYRRSQRFSLRQQVFRGIEDGMTVQQLVRQFRDHGPDHRRYMTKGQVLACLWKLAAGDQILLVDPSEDTNSVVNLDNDTLFTGQSDEVFNHFVARERQLNPGEINQISMAV